MMFKVLQNIVTNAVKYNKLNGRIEITSTEKDREISVIISDTGIGMSGEVINKAFTPFYRSDNVKHTEGNGLGLSIVKDNMMKMGASVNITSVIDVGTSIVLLFPADIKEKENIDILYVEDNIQNQQLMADIIKKADSSVETVETVMQAIEKLTTNQYKLILLDLGLPDGSGFDVISAAMDDRLCSLSNIYIITADASIATKRRAINQGIADDHFITKPIDVLNLIHLVKRKTAKRRRSIL